MHRRGFIAVSICFAVALGVAGCCGAGQTCAADDPACIEIPHVRSTDSPADPPAPAPTPRPVLPACAAAGDVALLYPASPLSNAALVDYQSRSAAFIAFRSGLRPVNPYLAVELQFLDTGGYELTNVIGAPLIDVTGSPAPFVPPPPPGFGAVYVSGNLPFRQGAASIVALLVDKRLYGECSAVRIATIAVQ